MKRLRRNMLFIPGDNPGMIQNADVFGADSVIFDLEDAVGNLEKDSSRLLVRNALLNLDFSMMETVVRVNDVITDDGAEDLSLLLKVQPDAIMVPKATEEKIKMVDELIKDSKMIIIPIIESAYSLETLSEIIKASNKVKGILFGAEDFTADMGIERTKIGEEIFYARNKISTACKAYGIDAMDTPFTDSNDQDGLEEDTRTGKSLGMTGKAAINPRQIGTINKVYSPTASEIEEAMKIVSMAEKAFSEGKGVISLDGKMIDAPIIARAERIMAIARQADII